MCDIDDTIAAVSSPPGPGAEAVIRISGPRSLAVAWAIFVPGDGGPFPSETFTAAGGMVSLQRIGVRIPATIYVMPAPATYTRQDIVEFHLPCSPPLLEALIEEICSNGARPGGPGEFTKRAYLNGRIDLNQAEAVLDMITAAHAADLSRALMQLRGFATQRIEALRREMLEAASLLELSIDFSDQELAVSPPGELRRRIRKVSADIKEILRRGRNLVPRHGVAAVLYGPANAGKSTLFNALAGREGAIVSHIPGTTRDCLEAEVNIEDFLFRLIDTAGLKEAADVIERLALSRTRECAEAASIRILVLDAVELNNNPRGYLEDAAAHLPVEPQVTLLNKMDAAGADPEVRAALCAYVRGAFPENAVIPASARDRSGLEALEGELIRLVTHSCGQQADFLPNIRQRHALESAAECVDISLDVLCEGGEEELVSFELRRASDALGAVTGRIAPEEVLDEIFGRFCIGK